MQLTAKPAASLGNDTCAGLGGKPKRGEAVSLFASRDDLVAAVVGSSSDGCAYPFRGGLVADALFSAPLPCPDGLPCLRVAAFPPATWAGLALAGNTLPLKRADVYPGRSGAPLPVAAADWLQASVNASAINATVVDALVRLARLDVAAWMSDRAAWTSW